MPAKDVPFSKLRSLQRCGSKPLDNGGLEIRPDLMQDDTWWQSLNLIG